MARKVIDLLVVFLQFSATSTDQKLKLSPCELQYLILGCTADR